MWNINIFLIDVSSLRFSICQRKEKQLDNEFVEEKKHETNVFVAAAARRINSRCW